MTKQELMDKLQLLGSRLGEADTLDRGDLRNFRADYLQLVNETEKDVRQFYADHAPKWTTERDKVVAALSTVIQHTKETLLDDFNGTLNTVSDAVATAQNELEETEIVLKGTGEANASSARVTGEGVVEHDSDVVANPYVNKDGYAIVGEFVVANSEATVRKLEEAGSELRSLLRNLEGENSITTDRELRMIAASLAGIVDLLAKGAVHLGLARDTRSWLQKFAEDHPEAGFALSIVQLLWGIITASLG